MSNANEPACTQGNARADRFALYIGDVGYAIKTKKDAARLARAWNCLPAFDAMREVIKHALKNHGNRLTTGTELAMKEALSLADESEKA